MIRLTARTGRLFLELCSFVGELIIFCFRILTNLLVPPFFLRAFFSSIIQIGWLSLPVVGITSFFTGGALALQIYAGGARFNAEEVVPSIVAIGMVRELGPVLGGLMVAARVAAVLAVPVLVGVGDSIGILGGYVIGTTRLDFNNAIYLINSIDYLEFWDVLSGLIKGAVFGCIISVMGCFFGMRCEKGARGVGQATKSAVVSASVLILAANYFLTEAFFSS
jgi:phospholipid/cholesterol/gamma-HCH transport system permease protein